jgi:hypothetical protein
MAIDQSPLGQHVQELMQEIEEDPEIPENAQIGRVVTIVEILGSDDENSEFANIRVRATARPYVALGFLEVAKALQLRMMGT